MTLCLRLHVPSPGGLGSIPGRGTRSHMLQLKILHERLGCVRLFVTPCTVLYMGFPRQEYWSGLPLPSPGDLLNLGIKFTSPALQANYCLSCRNLKKKKKKISGAATKTWYSQIKEINRYFLK